MGTKPAELFQVVLCICRLQWLGSCSKFNSIIQQPSLTYHVCYYSDEVKQKAEHEVKALAGLTGQPGHPGIVCYYESWTESPPQVWLKQFDSVIPFKDEIKPSNDEHEQERSNSEWLNPGQLLYVRMELCQETLKARLSSNTGRDQKQVQDIFRQTVDAVHYVHEHGLMHRDIKV